jgi:hypothetical protein
MKPLAAYATVVAMTPAARARLYKTATNAQLAALPASVSGMLSPIGDPGSRNSAAYRTYAAVVGGEIAKTGSNATQAVPSGAAPVRSRGSSGTSQGVSLSASGRYSYAQLEQIWLANGGPRVAAPIAAAIAMAESGGNPQATDDDSNGSVDRGLWQINSVHGAQSTYDVNANAKAAIDISSGGRDWSPWTTYTSGAYLQYLQTGTVPSSYSTPASSATPITRPGGQAAGDTSSGVATLFASYEDGLSNSGNADGTTSYVSLGSDLGDLFLPSSLRSLPGDVAASVKDVGTFLSWIAWIFHPRNILRAVEFLAGIGIFFYGLHSEIANAYGPANPAAVATQRGSGLVGDAIAGTAIGRAAQGRQGRRAGRSAARAEHRHQERSAAHGSAYKAEKRRQAKAAHAREVRKVKASDVPF